MEAYNPECLIPVVEHGGRSVVVWAAISWYSAGPLIALNSRITASDCLDILGNQVHRVVRTFTNTDAVRPYSQPEVFILGSTSMRMHFNIFLG
jgi:hypothetical protein